MFPDEWDVALVANYSPGSVLAPNQIEPNPSMFKQFHIKDLGRDPKTFNLEAFWEYEERTQYHLWVEEEKEEATCATQVPR